MTGASLRGIVVALLALVPPARADAPWAAREARGMGMGGISRSLARAPGVVQSAGFGVELGSAVLFAGSTLRAQAVRVRFVRSRCGFGVGFARLGSAIHSETESALAFQARWGAGAVGVALLVHEVRFPDYAPWRRIAVRLGMGTRISAVWDADARLALPVTGRAARVAATLRLRPRPRLELAVQYEREPGLAARLRAGAEWGPAMLRLRSGYDAATRSLAFGVGTGRRRVRLHWATESHPELGWSHAWLLELRP